MDTGEAQAAAKRVTVHFPTGRELLRSYWGLLANGGLVLGEPRGLREGDRVDLEVTIGTPGDGESFRLRGKVVRTPHEPESHDRVVIAFDPGEPHDVLLDAAWAETVHSPSRRQRRFPLDVDIRFHTAATEDEISGRLLNLSLGGCCLRVNRHSDQHRFAVGETMTLIGNRLRLPGVVRWSEGSCRGIEFSGGDRSAVEHFIKQFL